MTDPLPVLLRKRSLAKSFEELDRLDAEIRAAQDNPDAPPSHEGNGSAKGPVRLAVETVNQAPEDQILDAVFRAARSAAYVASDGEIGWTLGEAHDAVIEAATTRGADPDRAEEEWEAGLDDSAIPAPPPAPAPESPKPPPGPCEEIKEAVERVKAGQDFYTVVLDLAGAIVTGDVDARVAETVLLAVYGKKDGKDLFTAALLERTTQTATVPVLSSKDPLRTADTFLALAHTDNEADPPVRLLHRYESEYYRWMGTHYAVLDDPIIRAQVWRFLPQGNLKPNSSKVSNVLDAVSNSVHLSPAPSVPFWVTDPIEGYPEPTLAVALRSGLLDPDTGKVHPPTPKLFYRTCLPFDYDPADNAPPVEWLRFLDSLWGEDAKENGFLFDPQSIECLQEVLGYLLTSDLSMEKMFMCIGPPRSGKGTISKVIEGLLGKENVASSSLSTLATDHGLQNLLGKSALIIPDAMVSHKADIVRAMEELKKISGQDTVDVNPKNKPVFSTRLSLHILLFANEIPRFRDASGALSSRFIMLRMTRGFLGQEDPGLKNRLMPELPRILHWALAGRKRLYERGHFLMPDSAKSMVSDLEEQSSPITAFLRQCCDLGGDHEVRVSALWDAWRVWCQQNGVGEGSVQYFGRDVRAAVPQVEVRNKRIGDRRERFYVGVRLL